MKRRGGWKKKQKPCEYDIAAISMPGEEWRPVVGWERFYRVSSNGRVLSLHQTGRLVIGLLGRGYRVLKLRDGERKANAMVHRMVLHAFIGPAPDGHEGCHNNGDSEDNRLDNLRWDTKKANQADRVLHGTSNHGDRCVSARLTADQVREIRRNRSVRTSDFAKRFAVHPSTIVAARNGSTWTTLDVAPIRSRT